MVPLLLQSPGFSRGCLSPSKRWLTPTWPLFSSNSRCLSPLKDSWHKDLATSHFCEALGALLVQPLHTILLPRAAIFYQKADFFSPLSLSPFLYTRIIFTHEREEQQIINGSSRTMLMAQFGSCFSTTEARQNATFRGSGHTLSFAFALFFHSFLLYIYVLSLSLSHSFDLSCLCPFAFYYCSEMSLAVRIQESF